MGIKTILDARRILLLAHGENKADAIRDMVEGPLSAFCPASSLQLHQRTTILIDEPAASKLPDFQRVITSSLEKCRMIWSESTVRPTGLRDDFTMSENKIKVLVVGAGNMGRSHALAYASIPRI